MRGASRPARPVPEGQSAHITERQDDREHLERLLAYSRYYQVAHRWRRARTLGTFVLALAGPILAFFVPATSDLVAAIGAGWLVLGRTLLSWLEQRTNLEAVRVQELYDTKLFYLPWNAALVGRPPVPDDIATAARHITKDNPYRGWYSIDLGDTPWPADALLCQRQSAIWSRRDHRAYGTTVLIAGIAWFAVGLSVALASDLSLADYLIKIFLPSAPAFLDSFELARQHWHHAAARTHVEDKIHDLWQSYVAKPAGLMMADCREVQDSVYLLRRDGPRVPSLFYKIRKAGSEASTRAGTDALRVEESRHGGSRSS